MKKKGLKLPQKKWLSVACEAAQKAGALLMASYGKLKNSQIHAKSKNDFVTALDKRSERLIISMIKKNFPHHSIQAEESGYAPGSGTRWIIDPLDGTANYIHLFPMFSVSIGIAVNNEVLAGVVYDPLHREMFTAEKGEGAFLNGKKIRAAKTSSLSTAFMATGIPFRARGRFEEYLRSFEKISLESAGLRRGGSAALDLAYVACGRFDGFWEINLSPWDIAAGALLVQEAGGSITDMWGRRDYLQNGDVLASNRLIHQGLLGITTKIFTPKTEKAHASAS